MKLADAAHEAGVHYQTVYRWVRDGALPARKIRGAYEVELDDLRRLLARRLTPQPPPARMEVRDWSRQVRRLEAFLLEGDERAATDVVERLRRRRVPVLDVCRELLTPALIGVGVRWEQGGAGVAEEHRASAIVERLVARLFANPRGRRRGRCFVATPPGERHGLPAAMAAAVLRDDHWDVDHLATEVPPDDLRRLARRHGGLVVLSVTHPPAAAQAAAVRRKLEHDGVPVLVGHPGADLAELRRAARAVASGSAPSPARPPGATGGRDEHPPRPPVGGDNC